MGSARITYTPRSDATPEAERNALAAVYAFVAQQHQIKKKGDPATAPDDAEGSQHDRTDTRIIRD